MPVIIIIIKIKEFNIKCALVGVCGQLASLEGARNEKKVGNLCSTLSAARQTVDDLRELLYRKTILIAHLFDKELR